MSGGVLRPGRRVDRTERVLLSAGRGVAPHTHAHGEACNGPGTDRFGSHPFGAP